MGFLDKLKQMLKAEEKGYEEIMEERSKIKDDIAKTLKGAGFTELEIREVLVIVSESERKIANLKMEISRLAKSFDDPTARIKELKEEIANETKSIDPKLKAKVQEIRARKQARS